LPYYYRRIQRLRAFSFHSRTAGMYQFDTRHHDFIAGSFLCRELLALSLSAPGASESPTKFCTRHASNPHSAMPRIGRPEINRFGGAC
jgi:hypothetical protein